MEAERAAHDHLPVLRGEGEVDREARRDEKEAKAALSTSKLSFVEYSYDKVVLGLQQLTTIALSA